MHMVAMSWLYAYTLILQDSVEKIVEYLHQLIKGDVFHAVRRALSHPLAATVLQIGFWSMEYAVSVIATFP